MGRWWDWRRSPQADVTTVSREAESDSGWRGLAPIEPTVGSFAPTAQLHGFRSTLTTAHNPGLTAPPAAMSTSHGDQLSVMRLISEPVPENPPAQAAPASVPRSRQWSPRLPVQLTPVDSAPTPVRHVQALSAPSAPNGDIESGSGSDAFTSSLVRAADPQEQREVPVVSFTSEGPATASTQSVDSGSGSDAFTSSPVHAADPHRTYSGRCRWRLPQASYSATASTRIRSTLAPAPMLSPARRYMQPTRTYSGRCRWRLPQASYQRPRRPIRSTLAPAPMLSPARRYMQPTRTYSGQCRWRLPQASYQRPRRPNRSTHLMPDSRRLSSRRRQAKLSRPQPLPPRSQQ